MLLIYFFILKVSLTNIQPELFGTRAFEFCAIVSQYVQFPLSIDFSGPSDQGLVEFTLICLLLNAAPVDINLWTIHTHN